MSVERNAQQGDSHDKGNGHEQFVPLYIAFVYAPDDGNCQYDDVDHHAAVEGHAQRIHEEQFKPAAHLHDARYHAIKHHSHQYTGSYQSQ